MNLRTKGTIIFHVPRFYRLTEQVNVKNFINLFKVNPLLAEKLISELDWLLYESSDKQINFSLDNDVIMFNIDNKPFAPNLIHYIYLAFKFKIDKHNFLEFYPLLLNLLINKNLIEQVHYV